MRLLIKNPFNYHYEILESLIILFPRLIKIIFSLITILINPNESFENYLKNKYPKIIICYSTNDNFDYIVNATCYLKNISLDVKKNIYNIIHENLDFYDLTEKQFNQTISLTCLSKKSLVLKPFILPYQDDINTNNDIPIFIIQGNFNDNDYIHSRRNFDLLEDILVEDYQYKFKIKLLGRNEIPSYIENHPNVTYYKDLNFEDFHKHFLDAYAIIPCITKESHPQYYLNKYTSTISYGEAYKLYFLIDDELNKIYNPIKKISYKNNISKGFKKLLHMFYQKKNNN